MRRPSYLLRVYDDVPPQAAVVEMYLPAGEIWQMRGTVYVPPELGAEMGAPDDAMLIGMQAFPAWNLSAEHQGKAS